MNGGESFASGSDWGGRSLAVVIEGGHSLAVVIEGGHSLAVVIEGGHSLTNGAVIR